MAAEGGTEKAAAPQVVAPSTEERLVAWLQANRTVVTIGAGAIALIVLVTWFMSTASQRKENFARTQLEQAWGAADAGNTPLAASELQKVVDTLLIIPNQNLFRVANEKTTFADAFAMTDQVLYSGVACITDLMVKEGHDQPRLRRRGSGDARDGQGHDGHRRSSGRGLCNGRR